MLRKQGKNSSTSSTLETERRKLFEIAGLTEEEGLQLTQGRALTEVRRRIQEIEPLKLRRVLAFLALGTIRGGL